MEIWILPRDIVRFLLIRLLRITTEIKLLCEAWQKGRVVQNWRDRRGRIISALRFIYTSQFFKKFWEEIFEHGRSGFSLKSHDEWAEKMLFTILFDRECIWVLRELNSISFKAQNLEFYM
jgi:hypothetical protein